MNVYQNVVDNRQIKFKRRSLKIITISLRKNLLTILFCTFAICLVLFSNTNLAAAKNGLILWATAVVPSLFPFFVATELLSYTNVVPFLGKVFSKIMRPLFGVPGEAAFAFLMGLISGYPVGAKITTQFVEEGICNKEEGERMLSFTNNSGPLFIIGTVGITLFGSSLIGALLLITHILACITVGIILNVFRKKKKMVGYLKNQLINKNSNFFFELKSTATSSLPSNKFDNISNKKSASFSSLGEVLGKSIQSATSTVLLIGGFVVIFSVILSICNQSHLLDMASQIIAPVMNLLGIPIELIKPFLSGIIELTNGVNLVASFPMKAISINIILCAFLLGFGGISVLLQVFSITSRANLSIKKYVIGKLLQGAFAAFYTYLALQFLPFLQFNL